MSAARPRHAFAPRDLAAEMVYPLLDGLPLPLILLHESGDVLFCNCAMRGKLPQESSGTGLKSVMPDYHAAFAGDLRHPRRVSVTRHPAGAAVHERLELSRSQLGMVLTVFDQTELIERETADAQNARLASLGFMVAGVCHEVSNPLSAIHSMVQILRSKRAVSEETVDKGLANIASNISRVLSITRKLGDYSRVDTDRPAPVSVDEAVEEAVSLLRHSPWGASVGFDYSGAPGVQVLARPGQLKQVVFNILLNAAQAMQGEGSMEALAATSADGRVVLTIRDDGPGILPRDLARVFEPFFTTKRGGEGTGLGLAISFEIIHELGGSIRASNNPECGACFRVELPLHRVG
jgi:C4-dicarboxylate-specific signal transduction histidine kinase